MLSNRKIDEIDTFTCLFTIIIKGGGCGEEIKSIIAKLPGVVSHLKNFWKNWKIGLWTKLRILEGTVMTVV